MNKPSRHADCYLGSCKKGKFHQKFPRNPIDFGSVCYLHDVGIESATREVDFPREGNNFVNLIGKQIFP